MNYYYTRPDNAVAGPASLNEIRVFVANGALGPDPMIVPEGGTQWRPLSAITGAPPPPPVPAKPNAFTYALKDAVSAFQLLVTNPVGGLSPAFERLGAARAAGAGVVFGVVFAGCWLFAIYRFMGLASKDPNFIRALGVSLLPFGSLVVAIAVVRMIFRGRPGFTHDLFLAGAALLPFALASLAAALFLLNQPATTVAATEAFERNLFIFFSIATYLTVLMLYAGLTRVSRISDRAATIGVPCAVAAMLFLCYFVLDSMQKP